MTRTKIGKRINTKRIARKTFDERNQDVAVKYDDVEETSPSSKQKATKIHAKSLPILNTRPRLRDNLSAQDGTKAEVGKPQAMPKTTTRPQNTEQDIMTSSPATRASTRTTRRQTVKEETQTPRPPPRPLFKDTEYANHPWTKPLVYPATGPNRATVEFADLQRLDDDQLLNDNLVSFGIRYVQQKYPRSQNIYVFNTFFYSSLTGQTKTKINYDAVKRWTAKVDLFDYDHVVVPINEGYDQYAFSEAPANTLQSALVHGYRVQHQKHIPRYRSRINRGGR